jgi:ribose/xylose/arabinose/galactoside ABC-type transport system permease subunit
MVEIMKAYRRDSAVIAFDEPTASLTETEIAVLFKLISELRRAGKIILYVSHRMAEVFRITDDVVVLKDGRFVRKFVTADTNETELIRAMVGREIGDTYANLSRNTVCGDVILEVKGLVLNHSIKNNVSIPVLEKILNSVLIVIIAFAVYALLSVGMTILLIGGEIDFAAGAEAMFGGVVCAICLRAGMPIPLSVFFALGYGALAGLINAFLVNVMNLMSFIASIGMSAIYSGIAFFLTDAKGIGVSGPFRNLGASALFGVVPTPFIIMIALVVVYAFVLKYTDFGRKVYMVGGNRAAARLAGIDAKKVTTAMFVNNGIIAALAGVCLTSRMHVANPSAAASGALDAITASVLGGVSFMGGVGGMGGGLIGPVLLNVFVNGLTGINLPTYYRLIAEGILLIVALGMDYFSARARARNLE